MMYEYKCQRCGKVMQTKWPSYKRRYCGKTCAALGAWEEYRESKPEQKECFDPCMEWKRHRGRWLCPYQETVSCERRICNKCGWEPGVAEKRRAGMQATIPQSASLPAPFTQGGLAGAEEETEGGGNHGR